MKGHLPTSVIPIVAVPGPDRAEQSISDRATPGATELRIDPKTVAFGGPPKHYIPVLRSSCPGHESRTVGWM